MMLPTDGCMSCIKPILVIAELHDALRLQPAKRLRLPPAGSRLGFDWRPQAPQPFL
jgi:hypothetical protein